MSKEDPLFLLQVELNFSLIEIGAILKLPSLVKFCKLSSQEVFVKFASNYKFDLHQLCKCFDLVS